MAVVAVIGAGKLGGALARRALAAGHTVRVAGRVDTPAFRVRVGLAVPGAQASSVEGVVQDADLVVLALPLGEHRRLDGRSGQRTFTSTALRLACASPRPLSAMDSPASDLSDYA